MYPLYQGEYMVGMALKVRYMLSDLVYSDDLPIVGEHHGVTDG